MAIRRKVFSSLKDSKYLILQSHAKRYDVSEAEIIRTILERVLGNNKFEKLLLHDVMKDLIDENATIKSLPPESTVKYVECESIVLPEKCPECGKSEEMGVKVIVHDQSTNQWRCSNCFACGGL